MTGKTKIEWTDKSWNPIVGCSIVSPGCTNCYAMRFAGARLQHTPGGKHYIGLTTKSKTGPVWTGKLALAPEKTLLAPLRWQKPAMIFVNSMGDLFHESVPDEWILQAFAVMQIAHRHTFQVLTKRAERMRAWMSAPNREEELNTAIHTLGLKLELGVAVFAETALGKPVRFPWPAPHIWLGVSAEDQKHADERIPALLDTPAAVRFVSAEPLLGAIDFTKLSITDEGEEDWLDATTGEQFSRRTGCTVAQRSMLDWIIVGGESGHDARPMHPDWARSIRDQCSAAGVPFFFKQWGEWAPGECSKLPPTRTEQTAVFFDGRWHFASISPKASEEMHADDEPDLYRLGKSRAFRTLDGVTHDGMPRTEASHV